MEVLAIGGLIGGFLSFVLALLWYIAVMSTWSNTARTAKYLEELVRYKRADRGLDPNTGKEPK